MSDAPGSIGIDAAPSTDAMAADGVVDAPPDATPVDWNEGATSGTRLKLVWYQTADGVKAFPGWASGPSYYDAQRGEDCHPALWNDGNTYCTPGALSVVYADAACTTMMGQWWASTTCTAPPPPNYVEDVGTTGCKPAAGHLYQRGAPMTNTHYYTRNAAGGCSGPFTDSSYAFYAVGAEVSPSSLVEMTVGGPEGPGTLQLRWWQTADGMRAVERAYDSALGNECFPLTTYSSSMVCVPVASPAVVFQDSTCTQRDVGVSSACAEPPYAVAITDTTCPRATAKWYTTGAAVMPSPLYRINGSACQAITANAADTYYALGAEVMPTPVNDETDTIAGYRLQPHHFTASGFRLRDRTLYDTMLGGDCQILPVGDGTYACIPSNVGSVQLGWHMTGVVTAYTDPACGAPTTFVQVYTGPSTCAPLATPMLANRWNTANACSSIAEVHRVGAPYTGTVYYRTNTGCGALVDDQLAFYDGSIIVPNNELASAARVVDP